MTKKETQDIVEQQKVQNLIIYVHKTNFKLFGLNRLRKLLEIFLVSWKKWKFQTSFIMELKPLLNNTIQTFKCSANKICNFCLYEWYIYVKLKTKHNLGVRPKKMKNVSSSTSKKQVCVMRYFISNFINRNTAMSNIF